MQRLDTLAAVNWNPTFFMGFHVCEFCPTEGPDSLPARGGHNIWVPGKKCVYVAPELIRHYITVHQYRPPAEFCSALLRCPRPWTGRYVRKVLLNGPGDWRNTDSGECYFFSNPEATAIGSVGKVTRSRWYVRHLFADECVRCNAFEVGVTTRRCAPATLRFWFAQLAKGLARRST